MTQTTRNGKIRFDLERLAETVHIVRGYRDRSTKFFTVGTIVERKDGTHELCGWLSKGESTRYHADAVRYLWACGFKLSWKFKKTEFHLYERMFRSAGTLEIRKKQIKRYNNQDIEFYYGRIVPNGDTES